MYVTYKEYKKREREREKTSLPHSNFKNNFYKNYK